ncbi:MAG: response regulator, partial [Acidobacteria bacterium]|nr:response regulator [Acidobacteriota bacterium]
LERARETGQPFPLLLLDVHMPDMDGFTVATRIRENPKLASTTIVVLTSASWTGEAEVCRRLGIAVMLTKPIRQSDLRAAILRALGHLPAASLVSAAPTATERHTGGLEILVAEDNAVNQRLMVKLLEKQGHRVTVAATGREVLSLVGGHDFDLVLMDVQMPELNGFEATEAIRVGEQGTGRRLPIVAVTAHAMKGDRERCLAAGMDGYISKPIVPKELRALLDRFGGGHRPPGEAASESVPSEPALDREAALARAGGDIELLRELAELFRDVGPALLAEIRQAIDCRDADKLRRAAHSLKGSVGNFDARRAFDAAASLEAIGAEKNLERAAELSAVLEVELTRLNEALGELAQDRVA